MDREVFGLFHQVSQLLNSMQFHGTREPTLFFSNSHAPLFWLLSHNQMEVVDWRPRIGPRRHCEGFFIVLVTTRRVLSINPIGSSLSRKQTSAAVPVASPCCSTLFFDSRWPTVPGFWDVWKAKNREGWRTRVCFCTKGWRGDRPFKVSRHSGIMVTGFETLESVEGLTCQGIS